MKADIHPQWFPEAQFVCRSCNTVYVVGAAVASLNTEICANCHPFFTGEQRIVDTEGQVDRFYKKLEARTQYQSKVAEREAAKASPDQPIAMLGLGGRIENPLIDAGLDSIAKVVAKLESGDDALLAIEGIGRKSVIDLKKRLRSRGFLPEEPVAAPTEGEAA